MTRTSMEHLDVEKAASQSRTKGATSRSQKIKIQGRSGKGEKGGFGRKIESKIA